MIKICIRLFWLLVGLIIFLSLHLVVKPTTDTSNEEASDTIRTPVDIHTPDGKNLFGIDDKHIRIQSVEKLQKIPEAPKVVALTFDDGPHPRYTQALLTTLRELNVRATFFAHGSRIEKNPDLLRTMVTDGHEIGNHTWNHALTKWTPVHKVEESVNATDQLIQEITGIRPSIFRPPGGLMTDRIKQAAARPIILWSVDPQDWKNRQSSYIASHVIDHTFPGDIILLHDIYESTIESVPVIITALREKGYTFVTVSDLLSLEENHTPEVYFYKEYLPHTR